MAFFGAAYDEVLRGQPELSEQLGVNGAGFSTLGGMMRLGASPDVLTAHQQKLQATTQRHGPGAVAPQQAETQPADDELVDRTNPSPHRPGGGRRRRGGKWGAYGQVRPTTAQTIGGMLGHG